MVLTFLFEMVALLSHAPPPLHLKVSTSLKDITVRIVPDSSKKIMTILRMTITREWGRNEPGPLQPLRRVVEVSVRLLRVSGHVVFATKP